MVEVKLCRRCKIPRQSRYSDICPASLPARCPSVYPEHSNETCNNPCASKIEKGFKYLPRALFTQSSNGEVWASPDDGLKINRSAVEVQVGHVIVRTKTAEQYHQRTRTRTRGQQYYSTNDVLNYYGIDNGICTGKRKLLLCCVVVPQPHTLCNPPTSNFLGFRNPLGSMVTVGMTDVLD